MKSIFLILIILLPVGTAVADIAAKPGEIVLLGAKQAAFSTLQSANAKIENKRFVDVVQIRTAFSGPVFGSANRISKAELTELRKMCAKLVSSGEAEACSPNFVYRAFDTIPNDPDIQSLYGLERIEAFRAWDATTGSKAVTVAVVDTGIDLGHPDLVENLWTNSGEVPDDGIDNDGNGFVDDIHGFDFIERDGTPQDDNEHGTHVAGTIGARGNNGLAVVGVSHHVSLQAVRVLDAQGEGSLDDVVSGVLYAVENGAKVINMSLGSSEPSSVEIAAMRRAQLAGALVITASGNEGVNNDTYPSFPASYPLSNIIAVGASDEADEITDFSNYGRSKVDLVAPGAGVLSTIPGGGTEFFDGTSMAAPHVTGVAALILALKPTFRHADLRQLILGHVTSRSSLSSVVATGGRLNAADSVEAAMLHTPLQTPNAPAQLTNLIIQLRRAQNKKSYSIKVATRGFTSDSPYLQTMPGITIQVTCQEIAGGRARIKKSGRTRSNGQYTTTIRSSASKLRCDAKASGISAHRSAR
jgi:subtilisin family serine protease